MNTPVGPSSSPSQLLAAATLGGVDEQVHTGRRYGVQIGGTRLLLDGSGAVRVLDPGAMFRLPNTHHWFLGLANVRGNLVPVYDLALWQSLAAPDSGRILLVIGDDEMAAAVLVDESPRNLVVPSTPQPAPALSEGLAGHATQAFAMDDGVWAELDWDNLFSQLKLEAVISGGDHDS